MTATKSIKSVVKGEEEPKDTMEPINMVKKDDAYERLLQKLE